jgi:hypothetical protein
VLAWLALLCGCAHQVHASRLEAARKAGELFHHRARWKDYGGAALLLVPERRKEFDRARREWQDDRDLTLSDFQLEEVTLSDDLDRARMVSRMSWMRLPSTTEHTATVISVLEFRQGSWLIASQVGGPFAAELAPKAAPAPPPGG